jgi:hypothetical protein
MPTFSSGAFGQLRYAVETVIGTTPTAPGVNLRQTGPTMKAAISTTSSSEVRQDRLVTGLTRTDLNIDGGFNFEFSAKEYDPFLEALIGTAYAHYGTLGLGTVFGLTTAALSLTAAVAPTSTSAFTGLANGSWIKVVPPVAATQAQKDYFADAWFKVASTSTTVITLDASTPVTGAGLGITAVAGFAISQSSASNGASLSRGFTLEYNLSDIAKFLPFQGMRVNTFELDVQVGSIITGSMGFVGQNHGLAGVGMLGATTFTGGPTASQSFEVMNAVADVGMLMENGVNLLTGGSFIKSVKLSISNNMRGQKAVGVFGNAGVGLGSLELMGTLELYVADATYYNRWYSGANTSLAFGFADSAGNGYLFELDKVNFKDGGMNPGGQSDDVMLTLPFQAFYNAATNRGIRITRGVVA